MILIYKKIYDFSNLAIKEYYCLIHRSLFMKDLPVHFTDMGEIYK